MQRWDEAHSTSSTVCKSPEAWREGLRCAGPGGWFIAEGLRLKDPHDFSGRQIHFRINSGVHTARLQKQLPRKI